MTTSKIDSIAALIVTHLETISGLTASLGPIDSPQNHPFAMVRIDPGEQASFMYPQSYSDRYYVVGILLEGTKADVSNAVESIWKLWENASRMSAIGAYGAWFMQPMNAEEPFTYEGDMAIGSVEFDLRVRYAP